MAQAALSESTMASGTSPECIAVATEPSGYSITTSLLSTMVKDQDFWYEDGNLVLAAGNRLFRLYRGLLASRSPVFYAMVCSSSPKDEESFDGCPVVHLSDTSYEIQHFLRALIPMPSIVPTPSVPYKVEATSIEELIAVARLAHKYEVDGLLRQALDCLQTHYTLRLGDFWKAAKLTKLGDTPFYHAIGVVNLARLTGAHSMLPIALYECCALGGAIIRGWERQDGVVERLSEDDLERCIDGARALSRAVVQASFRVDDFMPGPECRNRDDCKGEFQRLGQARRTCSDFGCGDADLSSWARTGTEFCWAQWCLGAGCCLVLEGHIEEERRKIWEQLPAIFGIQIDGWNDPVA